MSLIDYAKSILGIKPKSKQPDLPQHTDHHMARKAEFVASPTNGQIMLVGDSITEAWKEPENARFLPVCNRLQIVNRGIAGDTSYGIMDVLGMLVAERPHKVFMKIGTNNLGWGTRAAVNRILPDILNIIRAFQMVSPGVQIYLQSILPVNAQILNVQLPGVLGGRTVHNIMTINKGLTYLAQNTGCTFVNLWPHFALPDGSLVPEYTTDGLHLSPTGYKIWGELLLPHMAGC